jgi:YfiH family protein
MLTPGGDDPFSWVTGPAGRALVCGALQPYARHAFTSRGLEWRGVEAAGSRACVAAQLGVASAALTSVRQVHGDTVLVASSPEFAAGAEADGLLATDPAQVVLVNVADCVPILIADRHRRAVAAVHAGWRGTARHIAAAAVRAFDAAGVPPEDLIAAIGPGIGPCCYQVDEPVRRAFLEVDSQASGWFVTDGPAHWRLDLWSANADQLAAAGVVAEAIHVAQRCTAHHPTDWPSFRRDGAGAGRIAAVIGIRPSAV